jgi:hypothetical protein
MAGLVPAMTGKVRVASARDTERLLDDFHAREKRRDAAIASAQVAPNAAGAMMASARALCGVVEGLQVR